MDRKRVPGEPRGDGPDRYIMREDHLWNKSAQLKKKIRAGHAAEKLENKGVPPPESP